MQTYDLIMLAVLTAATMLGAWQGMAWQIASIASVVFSYAVACAFREPVAAMLPTGPPWDIPFAMLIIYVVTSLVIWVVFQIVARFIDRLKLKEFDRQVGAVMGLGKGVLLCVVVTLFCVSLLDDARRDAVVHSHSGYYIAVLINNVHPLIPTEVHERLHPVVERLTAAHDVGSLDTPADTPAESPPGGFGPPHPVSPWPEQGAPEPVDSGSSSGDDLPSVGDIWSAVDRRISDGWQR